MDTPNEEKKEKKNNKMIILGGATAAACILLLVLSSALKNNHKKTPTANLDYPEAQQQIQNAEQRQGQSLQDFWNAVDDDNRPVKQNPSEQIRKAVDAFDMEDTSFDGTDTPDGQEHSYPPPSFVSKSGDTLIYENGIYQRIDWVKIPEEKPDTLVLNGKVYIELLQEQENK